VENHEPSSLVSIIMPVRDETENLRLAIEDLLAQTYPNIEILVCDDGSKPETGAVLHSFQSPKLRLFKNNTAEGQSVALTVCIEKATGVYIAIADADDRYKADRIAKQVHFMQANPSIGVCGTGFTTIPAGNHWELSYSHADIMAQMLINNPMVHPSVMLHATLLQSQGYNPSFKQSLDYELFASLRHKTQFANLVYEGVSYRLTNKSESTLKLRNAEADAVRKMILLEDFHIADERTLLQHSLLCNLEAGLSTSEINTHIALLLQNNKKHTRVRLEKFLYRQAWRYALKHYTTKERRRCSAWLLKSRYPFKAFWTQWFTQFQ
jgi:glycosyltransferase involved in cell wall biosynthesis